MRQFWWDARLRMIRDLIQRSDATTTEAGQASMICALEDADAAVQTLTKMKECLQVAEASGQLGPDLKNSAWHYR